MDTSLPPLLVGSQIAFVASRDKCMTRDRQGWFGGMLGGGGEVEGEAKNDMRTLQARAVYELCCPRLFCSCCAAQLVLEKQLQDIIRYTNELENREATMCVRKERLCTLQVPHPHPPTPSHSFRLLHENKTLKAEIASLQQAE